MGWATKFTLGTSSSINILELLGGGGGVGIFNISYRQGGGTTISVAPPGYLQQGPAAYTMLPSSDSTLISSSLVRAEYETSSQSKGQIGWRTSFISQTLLPDFFE